MKFVVIVEYAGSNVVFPNDKDQGAGLAADWIAGRVRTDARQFGVDLPPILVKGGVLDE